MFQPLESRQMLAASLSGGVLTVTGTNGPDHIGLDPRTTTQLRVEIGTAKQFFDLRKINKIVVNALGGNDIIEVNKRNPIAIGVEIHGGAGNDSIKGSNASDRLFGEAGNDFIEGKGGNDLIDGGTGTDILNDSGANRVKNIESRGNVAVVDDKGGQRDDKGGKGRGGKDDGPNHT